MKKVISITLNGVLFMIEEDALHELSGYLDSIKSHYGADGKEIVNDIEANMADKFRLKYEGSQQAITIIDVNEVISIMGTVEQMEESGEAKKSDNIAEDEAAPKNIKRLYRDDNNAILGGVCTGLAAYFSVDVVIIRLIFVALTIANGVGILIYLIMWMIVPLAKTSVQKLEMQGEPINLKNIEEVVKEKSEQIKAQSKKAFVSLRAQKSTFVKILSLPIVLIEAIIRFVKIILKALLPVARIVVGLVVLFGVFVSFVFTSFWAAVFLFKTDSPLWQTNFPIESIVNTKAYFVTVVSSYFSVLIFIVVALLLAVSILSKKRIINWTISIILFALLALNVTVTLIYGFDLASDIKTAYKKYISENMVEKIVDFKDFNSVSGNIHSGNIIVEKADQYSVVIKGLKDDVEDIKFAKEATSSAGMVDLKIEVDNDNFHRGSFFISRPVEVIIKTPILKEFDSSNFYDYKINGFGDEVKILPSLDEQEIEGGNQCDRD